ncbi:MAG: hypothetical protein KDD82_00955, partial [Planctomycetes bacterium]|nr:hypothetical protein [Planctomycetota bacterium]
MALIVIGCLAWLAGVIWLIALAAEESWVWALLMFCFGWVTALVFLAMHPDRWRQILIPFGLLVGGALFVNLGAARFVAQRAEQVQQRSLLGPELEAEAEVEVEVEPEAQGPTPEELRAQAYLELHEALRESTSPDERLALVERWREQEFFAVKGAWRDLIESLADGPSSAALEAAQLAETERLQ